MEKTDHKNGEERNASLELPHGLENLLQNGMEID